MLTTIGTAVFLLLCGFAFGYMFGCGDGHRDGETVGFRRGYAQATTDLNRLKVRRTV